MALASWSHVLTACAQEVNSGTPMDRIVLAGFSQGGALSLFTALQLNEPIGALVVKSACVCPA